MYNNILKNELIKKIIISIIMLSFGILMVMPIAWMLSSSLKYENAIFKLPIEWIPKDITLNNYIKAWTDFPFINWFYNTLKVSLLTIFLTLGVSSLGGYTFARMEFVGKSFLFFLFLGTMMIPNQVTLIPKFVLFRYLGLYNTHAALYLPWIFNIFSVFLFKQYFATIPFELTEAARIDGCSEFRIFWQVILPLAKPVVITLTILNFTWAYNSYMAPYIYITDMSKQMLSVGIRTFAEQYSQNYAMQMAGASCALLPLLVVYLFLQKYFIEGIAGTGLKG